MDLMILFGNKMVRPQASGSCHGTQSNVWILAIVYASAFERMNWFWEPSAPLKIDCVSFTIGFCVYLHSPRGERDSSGQIHLTSYFQKWNPSSDSPALR
jgi:hypothetical protein